MNNYQDHRQPKNFLHSKLVLIIFAIFILLFTYNVVKFAIKAVATAKNKNNAQVKIEELQKNKDRLVKDIDSLNTEIGKEEIIRSNYDVAKPGEGVIVVTDIHDKTSSQNNEIKVSLLERLKSWFK